MATPFSRTFADSLDGTTPVPIRRSDLDADLADAMAEMLDLCAAEPAQWMRVNTITPIAVAAVVMTELPDSLVRDLGHEESVRLADCTVLLAEVANPLRGDTVTFPRESNFYGTWAVLGVEQRGPAHRTVRLRQTTINRSNDPAVQESFR